MLCSTTPAAAEHQALPPPWIPIIPACPSLKFRVVCGQLSVVSGQTLKKTGNGGLMRKKMGKQVVTGGDSPSANTAGGIRTLVARRTVTSRAESGLRRSQERWRRWVELEPFSSLTTPPAGGGAAPQLPRIAPPVMAAAVPRAVAPRAVAPHRCALISHNVFIDYF